MDWIKTVPPYDSQYSATTHTDVQDCTAESFCHIYYMLTGVRVSPRALAVMAHLEIMGNRNIEHVLAIANQFGLVPWEDCPTPDSFTMDSYYTPLTPAENKPFPISAKLISADLNKSPLWTELAWGLNLPVATRHMVAQINGLQYFDSETGAPIKPLNYEGAQVVYQTSIFLTQETMHLANDNGTVYLVAGVNNKVKIGIADPESLLLFGDEPVSDEDTSAIPETKTLTTGFSIHNK